MSRRGTSRFRRAPPAPRRRPSRATSFSRSDARARRPRPRSASAWAASRRRKRSTGRRTTSRARSRRCARSARREAAVDRIARRVCGSALLARVRGAAGLARLARAAAQHARGRARRHGRRPRVGDGARLRPPRAARAAGGRLDLRRGRRAAGRVFRAAVRSGPAHRVEEQALRPAHHGRARRHDRRVPESRRHLPQRVQPVAGRDVRPRALPQRSLALDDVRQRPGSSASTATSTRRWRRISW